ncbi:MAG: ATP-binding protein [Polyangia bacterium]
MKKENETREKEARAARDLRRRAEERALETATEAMAPATLEEAERLVHELRVHRIELEMQNEELRRAQLALDASRTRYFALYDLAPVGYVTLSERSLVLEANLRACTLLGIPRGALAGQPLTRFIAGEDQDLYYLHRKKLFETGEPQAYELRMKQPGGNQIWARMEAALATGEAGEEPVCRVTLSDITEEKRLRTQLAVADRLSSLGLLAASTGHEVNNPLTYVLYNVETLAEDLPAVAGRLTPPDASTAQNEEGLRLVTSLAEARAELGEMSERARSAVEGARRIREIIKGMRAFSRVDEELIEPLSLNSLVETALTMAAKEISARARLVRDLGPVPNVSANRGQMCQVFLNLLVNAAHSIEEGRVDDNEISVRTRSEGGDVLAEISDTGAGISAGNLDKVFDPFFTTKPAGSGTGLGLSICMRIVSALGGTLSVESKVKVGSTFTVRLPAVAPSEDSEGPFANFDDTSAEGASPRRRILVIDDEAFVREALVGMLKDYETVVAASGTEGRSILVEDSEFDVILCDLMMPGLSGMDLFTWLKDRDPDAAKRVVFITGGAFTPKTQDFLAAVDPPTLNKPFDGAHLRASIATLIQEARRNRNAS